MMFERFEQTASQAHLSMESETHQYELSGDEPSDFCRVRLFFGPEPDSQIDDEDPESLLQERHRKHRKYRRPDRKYHASSDYPASWDDDAIDPFPWSGISDKARESNSMGLPIRRKRQAKRSRYSQYAETVVYSLRTSR